MYSVTGIVFLGQYLIADVFGFTLVSPVTGQPMKASFATYGNFNNFQKTELNFTQTQRQDMFSFVTTLGNQIGAWGNIFWNLFLLFTGSGIWLVLIFFGVPVPVVIVILIPYYILLFRTAIGYLKNFF